MSWVHSMSKQTQISKCQNFWEIIVAALLSCVGTRLQHLRKPGAMVRGSVPGEECRDLIGEICPSCQPAARMTVLLGQVQRQSLGRRWGKAVLSVSYVHKSF